MSLLSSKSENIQGTNNNTLQTLRQQKLELIESHRSGKFKVFVTCNGRIIWNLEDMRNRMFAPTRDDANRFAEELYQKYPSSESKIYKIYLYSDNFFPLLWKKNIENSSDEIKKYMNKYKNFYNINENGKYFKKNNTYLKERIKGKLKQRIKGKITEFFTNSEETKYPLLFNKKIKDFFL